MRTSPLFPSHFAYREGRNLSNRRTAGLLRKVTLGFE
jgi:hypothetical protein